MEYQNLKAAFDLNLDLLVQWKPFYYEFSTNVSVQLQFETKILRVHKTVNMDVGADLEIWGPDFSGKADIDIKVFGMKFDFGLNFGSKTKAAKKVDWLTFKDSFLPDQSEILAINVVEGMIGREGNNVIQVNPKDLLIRFETTVPANSIDFAEETSKSFGVYPMKLGKVHSNLDIEVSDEDAEFEFGEVIYKNVPAALWSKRDKIELNTKPLVTDTIGGFTITVAPPQFDYNLDIKSEYFDYDMVEQSDKWDWNDTNYQTESDTKAFDFEAITKSYDTAFHLLSKTSEEVKLFRAKLVEEEIG